MSYGAAWLNGKTLKGAQDLDFMTALARCRLLKNYLDPDTVGEF